MRQEGLNLTIIEALQDKNLLGASFRDLESWKAWLAFLKAIFNLPMTEEELSLYRQCTQRQEPPKERVRECYVVAGRRSGKSMMAAAIATYLACFKDWKQYLGPGEKAWIFVLAVDRFQAGIIFRYIKGFFKQSKFLTKLIEKETTEELWLRNDVVIAIKTSSFRSVRGYTIAAAILEELCFWRGDETSANPDREIVAAVRPALITIPESILIGISSPYMRAGFLYDQYKRYFGQDDGPLIWQAPSRVMNPTLDEKLIEKSIAEDPEAGRSEFLAEWRQDLSSFLDLELIERSVIPGRYELPPMAGVRYTAFCDPSGGRGDAMTLSICHVDENEKIIQDVLLIKNPPFDPAQAAAEFSEVLKKYGIYQIRGDKYAGAWVSEAFRKNGIAYEPTDLNKSEIYLEFLPLLTQGRMELLDNKRLVSELRNLERRTRTGGRDVIDHPVGLHDDAANSTAGSIVLAAKWSQPISIWFPFDDRPSEAALNFMSGKRS
jgi:hypothetical protein